MFLELLIHCEQELKIDRHVFNSFIKTDIMKFWEERYNLNIDGEIIDDEVINLFSLLDNKIRQYSQKWDRSLLITVITNDNIV